MNHDLIERAARAVLDTAAFGATHYPQHTPVSDWALDALEAALAGDDERAQALLDEHEEDE